MNMQPIPKYGDLITIEEFKQCVQCGAFIPYDGDGCYATETRMDDDSNVWMDDAPDWATHVMWFNR